MRRVQSAEGGADRGDPPFGVAIRGRTGPPRRRAFLFIDIMPRIHMRYDRATDRGAHQQRQFEILWRSGNSCVGEVVNRHEGDQYVHGGRGEGAKASYTYCGRALDDSAGQSGGRHVRVSIPCAHGGSVHARCMLDRADRIARGHTDPRPTGSVPISVAGGKPTSPPVGTG